MFTAKEDENASLKCKNNDFFTGLFSFQTQMAGT